MTVDGAAAEPITSGIYVLQCGYPTATGTGGPGYTVFGTITGGMKVLDSIAATGTADPAGDGTPKRPVVISTATPS